MKKNKLIIIICILISVVLLSLFLSFNSNKLRGTINSETSGFNDKNLYDCVTAAYLFGNDEMTLEKYNTIYDNYQNTINFIIMQPETSNIFATIGNNSYRLSDEQLSTITSLQCSDVSDTTGIEKLTALEELDLSGDFNSINLSNNKNLISVELNGSFSNLNLSNSPNITSLKIDSNELAELDLTNNKSLTTIEIKSENLTKLDLSNIESLNTFGLYSDSIESLSMPKQLNNSISISSDSLKNIYMTNTQKSREISLTTPNLNTIEFKENSTISALNIYQSNLVTLDLRKVKSDSVLAQQKILYGIHGGIATLKTTVASYSYSSNEVTSNTLREVEFEDGSFFKLNSDELQFDYSTEPNLVIKNSSLGLADIKNNIKIENLNIKICSSSNCSSEIYSDDNVDEAYLNIYSSDKTLVKSFKIKFFDNTDFGDFKLYNEVITRYNQNTGSSATTKTNLTAQQLTSVKNVIINSDYRINNLTGLEKLTSLKSLQINGNVTYESISPLQLLSNLTLYNVNADRLDLSQNINLKTFSIENSKINNLIISNKKLSDGIFTDNKIQNIIFNGDYIGDNPLTSLNLENNNLDSIDISKLVQLTELNISENNIEELNLTNNSKLKELNINKTKIKKIIGLGNTALRSFNSESNSLEEFTLDNCNNLNEVAIMSNKLKKIDLGSCNTINSLNLIGNNIQEIKNLENSTNLMVFKIFSQSLENIDLSNMNNLALLYLGNAPATRNSVNMLAGTSINHTTKVKFPSHFKLTKYNEDDYIANYDEENNMIIANNPGQTTITSIYPSYIGFEEASEVYTSLKTTINVFDIKSSKFSVNSVNKEYKYIFNENNEETKVLNRYIKVYGEDVSKKIEDNKLYMYSGNEEIFTFDILKFTSDDYKIDNTKDTITYSGTFDISKLKVVNGSLNKIDNEVQLICNDNIVETYKLEKK